MILKNKIFKQLFGFSLSSWATALLTLIIVPIASHLYGETELGKINFYLSVTAVLYSLLCLGLDQGYVRFYSDLNSDTKRQSLMSFNLMIVALGLICMTALILVLHEPFGIWLFGEDNCGLLAMLPLNLGCLLLLRFYSLTYRMKGKIAGYAIVAILHGFCSKGLYILSVPLGRTIKSAVIFSGWACLFIGLITFFYFRKLLLHPAFKENKILYWRTIQYSFPLIPAVLMSLLNNNIPQLMLRSIYGFEYIAGFSMAVTVASALNIFQSGFNTFWVPYVFKNYQDHQVKIQKAHYIVSAVMTFVAMLIVLVQKLMFLIVNRDYNYVTSFLPFLILTPLCYTIGETTNIGIAISRKTYWNSLIYLLSLLTNFVLSFLLIPIWNASGAAIAAGTSAVIALICKTIIGNKYYRSVETPWPMIINIGWYVFMAVINLIFMELPYLQIILFCIIFVYLLMPHNRKIIQWFLQLL